jgi:AcrR family transcriptional regulator
MIEAATISPVLPRKASRDQRRQQLIEATVETIARYGAARTTLTAVASAAGLSHGLVNFHFSTKEKLLTETLLALSAEYIVNWTRALAAAGPEPAHQLAALIEADFNPTICTRSKLAAWCAFWSEAQSGPLYREKCGANDDRYVAVLEEICARLIGEGGYGLDPIQAARVLRVTVEGLWLDIQTMPEPYTREESLKTVYTCASAFFPRHFSVNGLIQPGFREPQ